MNQIKFGTDGVRGEVNQTLKLEDVLALGMAHGYSLRTGFQGDGRPRVVVGRDSRVSGDALLGAYGAGLMCQGIDLLDLGVLPTPGVAFAVRFLETHGGAMISASHNPVPDNGIKLFRENGKKLGDTEIRELEDLIGRASELPTVDGSSLGRRTDMQSVVREAYHRFLSDRLEGRLEGMKIVLDCAYGAAAGHARTVFAAAGAEVVSISDEIDGERINVACGSTDLSPLRAAVKSHGADLGLAFDGDADRCLAVAENGAPVTGDQMIVVIAKHLKAGNRLANDRVVLTVMSNLGAELALRREGVEVVRTQVGDRYVYEEMERSGTVLGGEQSGHLLLLDRHWSGDGLLAGLVFAGVLNQGGTALSELLSEIPEMPQKLVNVAGVDRSRLETEAKVLEAIRMAEKRLGPEGRLLVRSSGTEPLIRLMAEGPDLDEIDGVLSDLRDVVVGELSL